MGKVAELKRRRGEIYDQRKAIIDAAETADRDLTADETAQFAALGEQSDQIAGRIERLEAAERAPRIMPRVREAWLEREAVRGS